MKFPDYPLDFAIPKVMGILNLTPDSFFDGGKYILIDKIMERVEQMLLEGADIIDAGACSSRPGAIDIGAEEEIKRLLPVIKELKASFPHLILSVDTYHAIVAKKAIECGANLINDISGGSIDEQMFDVIAEKGTPYVLMHMKGRPQNMQLQATYDDLVSEMYAYFVKKIESLHQKGVDKIIIDPGFGFGKSTEHNFILLENLGVFKTLPYPLLVGISRKSMISKTLDVKTEHALNGTTVANTIALMKGADILRVHDIKEAKEAIQLVQMLKNASNTTHKKQNPNP